MNLKSKARVLLVEDNSLVADVLRFNLRMAGYTVDVAKTGQDALEKAKDEQFDLVLTDERMPIMNGSEFCRLLRSDERYSETPIIFITAKKYEREMNLVGDELGVSAVFHKPFSPHRLLDAIGSALEARPPILCA